MGVPASTTTAEIYEQPSDKIAISMALHSQKIWGKFFGDNYSILNHTHLSNFFNHINNLHQTIKFIMKKIVIEN